MSTPPLPNVPKKYEYENAQFDPDSPSTLDGVMQRWVVPEGEEEKEPVTMIVPHHTVHVEEGLFADTNEEKMEEGHYEKDGTTRARSSGFLPSPPLYFFGFIIVLCNLAFLIFILLTRK